MGYLDKIHKQLEAEKLAKKLMATKEYQEAKKKDLEQARLQGYICGCITGCDFLELRHRYRRKGITRFCKFILEREGYVSKNEYYFLEMNKHYKEEMELDVLDLLGYAIAEGGEIHE